MNTIQQEYEEDFYKWTFHNAALLREKRFDEIDIENLAEEIESMGNSDKRELMTRLALLMSHLLKWEFQVDRRGTSWKLTIKHQRATFKKLLQNSPSLKNELSEKISEAYEEARVMAADETNFIKEDFPEHTHYTLDQLLDENFFPKP